jgi:hypothetical protein
MLIAFLFTGDGGTDNMNVHLAVFLAYANIYDR